MSPQDYPYELDCAWLASDAAGLCAIFITGGEGPILPAALRGDFFPVGEVERKVLDLPVGPGQPVRLHVVVPDPTSYLELAGRGFFVYDWAGSDRITGRLDAYELVAEPAAPIGCAELPQEVRLVAEAVQVAGLLFSESKSISFGR